MTDEHHALRITAELRHVVHHPRCRRRDILGLSGIAIGAAQTVGDQRTPETHVTKRFADAVHVGTTRSLPSAAVREHDRRKTRRTRVTFGQEQR